MLEEELEGELGTHFREIQKAYTLLGEVSYILS